MRICASLGHLSDLKEVALADMIEIRLDILGSVPNTGDKETIVTFRDGYDLNLLPEDFSGLVDVGEEKITGTSHRIISSIHDYEKTPSADEIYQSLESMDSEVSKGAYLVRDFKDLHSILKASEKVTKDHVILGMGEMGEITRIRSKILGNMFTFAYISKPTAPGQISLEEMSKLDENSIITGLVGNPLDKSKSRMMHNKAFAESGISGRYLNFPSPSLECIGECIRGYNIRGINVTIPYKESVIPYLDEIDPDAETAGAVNTIVNSGGKLKGYNTDIDGIEIALENAGFEMNGKRMLIMGSGGAARACIIAALRNNAEIEIIGRNEDTVNRLSSEFGIGKATEESSLFEFDIIVNATPIGMYGEETYPVNLDTMSKNNTVFDMVYGIETPLMLKAKEIGCRTISGEDMLAIQGARAFELWTGVKGTFDVMRSCL